MAKFIVIILSAIVFLSGVTLVSRTPSVQKSSPKPSPDSTTATSSTTPTPQIQISPTPFSTPLSTPSSTSPAPETTTQGSSSKSCYKVVVNGKVEEGCAEGKSSSSVKVKSINGETTVDIVQE